MLGAEAVGSTRGIVSEALAVPFEAVALLTLAVRAFGHGRLAVSDLLGQSLLANSLLKHLSQLFLETVLVSAAVVSWKTVAFSDLRLGADLDLLLLASVPLFGGNLNNLLIALQISIELLRWLLLHLIAQVNRLPLLHLVSGNHAESVDRSLWLRGIDLRLEWFDLSKVLVGHLLSHRSTVINRLRLLSNDSICSVW